MKTTSFFMAIYLLVLATCKHKQEGSATRITTVDTTIQLPAPYTTSSAIHFSKVIGWPAGKTPIAPAGFTVTEVAGDFHSPRWMYVGPNGDIFVAEANTERSGIKAKTIGVISGQANSEHTGASPNRIILLRDTNHDGKPEFQATFLTGLNQPFGMLILNNFFYVANTDGLLRFPYKIGQNQLTVAGQKILNLPAGGYNNHWTRNLLASRDGSKIFITVGSGSNVQEHGPTNEVRRANILVINPDGTGERVFASGLRNPVGLAWQPGTKTLYTAVNERDELGDELVPDYMTSVKEGAFYGWPYAYYGRHEDPRRKGERPDLVKKAIVPDVPLGAHTASLGLTFYDNPSGKTGNFPARYQNGAYIGQHGSWNRSTFAGYKVVFVPFMDGKPGKPEDFLTGFIASDKDQTVYGRPVGVTETPDGSLLVADDVSDKIWRVSAIK